MNNIWAATWRNTGRRLQSVIFQGDAAMRSSLLNTVEKLHATYYLQRSAIDTHSPLVGITIRHSTVLAKTIRRGQSITYLTQGLVRHPFSTSVVQQKSRKSISKRSESRPITSRDGTSKILIDPLQSQSSSPEEFQHVDDGKIAELFGPTVSKELGNEILYTLQGQRATGTLDYGLSATGVDDDKIADALSWLRVNYPMDEDAAIIRRIEEEEREEEQQLIANAERIGLYKPQQDVASTGIYGKSELEEIRKRNEEQSMKSLQADEARHTVPGSAGLQSPQARVALARRTESAEWVKRYKEKAILTQSVKPPEMSKTARLLPAAIFGAVVITLSVLFAQNYKPPPRNARLLPDTPPAAATIQGLIAINIAVFLVWRMPPMWRFLNRYFLVVPGSLRVFSLLGNVFSHQSPVHLAVNMTGMWFMGTQCEFASLG